MPCSLCGAPAVTVVDLGSAALAACRGCIGNVLDVKRAMTDRMIFTTVPSSSTSFDTSATDARAIFYPPTNAASVRMIPPRETHAPVHCNRAYRRRGLRPRR